MVPSALRQFDLLVIEFPFVDQERVRLRPALVLSPAQFIADTGVASLAMITREAASPWPGDVVLVDQASAGLHKPSKVRMKFHSVAVDGAIAVGQLAPDDQRAIRAALKDHLAL